MTRPGKPIWPKVSPSLVKAALAGHSALGLAFAALIYLVCFSGTVAVFTQEWVRWESPEVAPIAIEKSAIPAAIDRAFAEAALLHPGAENIYLNLPEEASPRFKVSISGSSTYDDRIADASGHIIGAQPARPFSQFEAGLHFNLHMPQSIGGLIVGFAGIALLGLLVSGILAHPRIFRDAFHLRWGGSKRVHEADLHNRIGVWALPFHIAIALTGAVLGMGSFLTTALPFPDGGKGETRDRAPPAIEASGADITTPSVAPMLDTIRSHAQQSEPRYLSLNKAGHADQTTGITMMGPETLSFGDAWSFDASGAVIPGRMPKHSLGASISGAITQVHFGWFGAWPVKIAYVLLGAATTVLTASGVGIWLARRRDKGRPAPAWERIWSAFCWGQPPAYAVAAIAALLVSGVSVPHLLTIWAVVTALTFATVAIWPAHRISSRLRALSAVLLAAVPMVHVAVHGAALADPVATVINVTLAALATLTGLSLLRPARISASADEIATLRR